MGFVLTTMITIECDGPEARAAWFASGFMARSAG